MVSIDGLTVEFGGTTLFKDVSFVINERDRIALMGKNGAGKSTLLKMIALNDIGSKLELEHSKTKYFYSDFKKNRGIEVARAMRIQYDLYQQLYCGCKYTYEEGLQREKEKGR